MAESDQEMMERIRLLAGQINRHKNGQSSHAGAQAPPGAPYPPPQHNQAWPPARGGYRGRGTYRGGRGARGGAIHRNRTLVLNQPGSTNDNTASGNSSDASTSHNPAWVVKTDRHMQLINPAIYEKQSADRAKAIEETRLARLKQNEERQKQKLANHLARLGSDGTPLVSAAPGLQNQVLLINGIKFVFVDGGNKLKRMDGDAAKLTPKHTKVAGVNFVRSKHGNLYLSTIVKAQRYGPTAPHKRTNERVRLTRSDTSKSGIVKKIDEPCKIFSTTGVCPKPRCRYNHDPAKVAVCKEFLTKGECTAGDSCDLSHDLTPERTPACLHFAKGNCSKENCRYSHVRVSPGALVCRAFGIYGYCEKGAACTERHVHECPDFSNIGVCNTKGCKLPHRLKASTLRKNAAKMGDEGESSDLSSDDDADEIDSDDVDSDDLEFLGGDDGEMDAEVPQQSDFIRLG